MGLGLEPDLVAALEARTEGWVTGLQLAVTRALRFPRGVPVGVDRLSAWSGLPRLIAATCFCHSGACYRRSGRMPFTKHSPTLRSGVCPYTFRHASFSLFCGASVCAFHFAVQRAKLGGFFATAVGTAAS